MTGKTRGLLEYVNYLCETYPNIRILFLRQTRESLNESVLVTWETEVLWAGHPAMVGEARRNNRQYYEYPNGSHVVLGGLDKVERTFSAQYDVICCFEAREISYDSWQALGRCNRNYQMPFQQRIADTNPAQRSHWLNQLAIDSETGPVNTLQRIRTTFKNNPRWWDHDECCWTKEGDEYVEGVLKGMTGARRANLYEGRWASEEGMVYESFDPEVHMVDEDDIPELTWFFGSFDQGYRHPGCFQVWGVDADDRMYRVFELYMTGQHIDWWAERVHEAHREYEMQALVCDPAQPDYIKVFNDMMGWAKGRDGERIARRASNQILPGIALCQEALAVGEGGPRIFFMRGAHQLGRDEQRIRDRKCASLEEEIDSYVWAPSDDMKPVQEKPNPLCADHAMDAMRYAARWKWQRNMTPPPVKPQFERFSYGAMLGHTEILDEDDPLWFTRNRSNRNHRKLRHGKPSEKAP